MVEYFLISLFILESFYKIKFREEVKILNKIFFFD